MERDRWPNEEAGGSGFALESERVILLPVKGEELERLHAIFTEPEVRRYLLDDQVVPADWVSQEIERSEALFAELGCGLWSIREKSGAGIAGFVGLCHFFEPPELQLVYGLHPSRWGVGLATEAARAVLDYVFVRLGFQEVAAATDIPNDASVRVMKRLGMVFDMEMAEGEAGTVVYTLARTI